LWDIKKKNLGTLGSSRKGMKIDPTIDTMRCLASQRLEHQQLLHAMDEVAFVASRLGGERGGGGKKKKTVFKGKVGEFLQDPNREGGEKKPF